MSPKLSLIVIMILVAASQFFTPIAIATTNQDAATLALNNAEDAIILAYQNVLKAEEAGANVSRLVVRLNEAGGFLARARMAYRLGDFEEAAVFANSSREISVEVVDEADGLKDLAISEDLNRRMVAVIISVVGIVLVAMGSFWVLYLPKRHSD